MLRHRKCFLNEACLKNLGALGKIFRGPAKLGFLWFLRHRVWLLPNRECLKNPQGLVYFMISFGFT